MNDRGNDLFIPEVSPARGSETGAGRADVATHAIDAASPHTAEVDTSEADFNAASTKSASSDGDDGDHIDSTGGRRPLTFSGANNDASRDNSCSRVGASKSIRIAERPKSPGLLLGKKRRPLIPPARTRPSLQRRTGKDRAGDAVKVGPTAGSKENDSGASGAISNMLIGRNGDSSLGGDEQDVRYGSAAHHHEASDDHGSPTDSRLPPMRPQLEQER